MMPSLTLDFHGFFNETDFVLVNKPLEIEIVDAKDCYVFIEIMSVQYNQAISTNELVEFPRQLYISESRQRISLIFRESSYQMYYNDGFYISVSFGNHIVNSTQFIVFEKVLRLGGFVLNAESNKHFTQQSVDTTTFNLFRTIIEEQAQSHKLMRQRLMEKIEQLTNENNALKLRDALGRGDNRHLPFPCS